jgi:hypothetical protein
MLPVGLRVSPAQELACSLKDLSIRSYNDLLFVNMSAGSTRSNRRAPCGNRYDTPSPAQQLRYALAENDVGTRRFVPQ